MNLNIKSPKNSISKRESRLAKLLRFKEEFGFDDIIQYEDVDYKDQYDDIIVGGVTKFDDDFYKDDFIYYID